MQSASDVLSSSDHDRLLSLLDTLTAIRMDLTPLCESKCAIPAPPVPALVIREACRLLHVALADLRSVIEGVDAVLMSDQRQVGDATRVP